MAGHLGWGIMEEGWRKGPWTAEEDKLLIEYVRLHGEGRWNSVARLAGRTDNEIKNYWRTHFKKKAKRAPDDSDKAKARILRRQQFQQQQQQLLQQQQQEHQQRLLLQQQQQQQQQVQSNQFDMKRIMSLLDETEHKVPYVPMMCTNTTNPYPGTTDQLYPTATINGDVSSSDTSNEAILWDGLWNLDDNNFYGDFGAACATSKASLHNLVTHFC
ncbi:hypothetical protein GQ457_12G004570 [Hibiscus cannabinus]